MLNCIYLLRGRSFRAGGAPIATCERLPRPANITRNKDLKLFINSRAIYCSAKSLIVIKRFPTHYTLCFTYSYCRSLAYIMNSLVFTSNK